MITREEIEEILDYNAGESPEQGITVIENNLLSDMRWTILKQIIFNYHGIYYRLNYQIPATENQECDLFLNNEPKLIEVFPKEVIVTKYFTEEELKND